MTIWVVAADSARARIFAAQSSRHALIEVRDLVHPESRSFEQTLVSDASGSARSSSTQSGGDTIGEGREAKSHEVERFAAELGRALCAASRNGEFDRLHLLAAPAFLGHLRPRLDQQTRERLRSEKPVSVIHESAQQIRARLPARI